MGLVSRRSLVAALPLLAVALFPNPAAAAASVTEVASGLDSPRGIAFYGHQMLVAEAGHGGDLCFQPPDAPPGAQVCVGFSSQISRVDPKTKSHEALVKGLFSINLGPEGTLGASGLTVGEDRIFTVLGGTAQELPDEARFGQARDQAGHLLSIKPSGDWRSVAPVGEADFNFTLQFTQPTPHVYSPGTQEHDANPYGVLASEDGVYVADAGSNTLDLVSGKGEIQILQHFGWRDPNPDNFPSDAVPTCVVRTGDALWVGQLSGRLERIEDGKVTLVEPKDSAGKQVLTHVTGCVAREGSVYFVNMFGPGVPFSDPSFFQGSVVKFSPETGKASVIADHLAFPNMPAIGPDGNLYVTAGAICPADGSSPFPPGAPNPCVGGGKVLRIALPHSLDDN